MPSLKEAVVCDLTLRIVGSLSKEGHGHSNTSSAEPSCRWRGENQAAVRAALDPFS